MFSSRLYQALEKCKSISELKRIHALLITLGISHHDPFASKLLSSSVTVDLHYSYHFFLQLSNPTTFNWNTLIRASSNSKNPNTSVSLYVQMLRLGVPPDHLTYPFLAKASSRLSSIQLGKFFHAHIIRTGFLFDRFVQNSFVHMYASCGDIVCAKKMFDEISRKNLVSWNSILDGYAKCGDLNSARQVFASMLERDVVSWSSFIDGCVKAGEHEEALDVFDKMLVEGPVANEVTMVSILCACTHLGALARGRKMHRLLIDNGLPLTLVLCTSLVDMYAKCGAIEEALCVFRGVPTEKTDVLIWNAIIGGLATHGLVKESLDMYTEMQIAGIVADEITFLCLLSACAHGGLVREAWYFFECLGKHGMTPKLEHYACMIDVLARAGQLAEAYQFLCEIPVEPTASMLGALLSGCLNHRRFDLAEVVGKKLIELEPDHDGRYVGLSNAYALVKRWDEARYARETMEQRGVKKTPGCSFVELPGSHHKFMAHDRTHPMSEKIYDMLNVVAEEMKADADDINAVHCFV
ncbi:Pentatricopeptide repeat [Dillenia turbinata]|uniref:Pentatricopeptide repeat n=1 Tax=Dillenia turbinata TaxID=194707 RepID=A0AAN8Z5L8_9MAGN